MDLQQRQSSSVKHHAPYKAWGIVISELCRASTVQLQFCTHSSPLLESTCPAMRQNHAADQSDGKRSAYPSFNAIRAIGRASCPQSLSVQLQRHKAGLGARAAAFGYSLWVLGILLVSVHCINWTGCCWGGRLLSQHQGFWVFVLLVSKISPDCKAKSFFSSCRNQQSLAHSLVCHFVLHHALF